MILCGSYCIYFVRIRLYLFCADPIVFILCGSDCIYFVRIPVFILCGSDCIYFVRIRVFILCGSDCIYFVRIRVFILCGSDCISFVRIRLYFSENLPISLISAVLKIIYFCASFHTEIVQICGSKNNDFIICYLIFCGTYFCKSENHDNGIY